MNAWTIRTWSHPAEKMVYISITDGKKVINKNYSQEGSFFKFMLKYGLLDSYGEISRYIWG